MRGVGVFCVGWLQRRVDIRIWFDFQTLLSGKRRPRRKQGRQNDCAISHVSRAMMMWSFGETPQPAATGANSMAGMGHRREATPSNSSSLVALHSGLEQAHEAHAGS